jgi:hypothetical protein
MTFPTRSFAPTDLSQAEIVHTSTFGDNVNDTDTLESYKLERAEREHARRVRDMRHAGYGQRYGICG